MTDASIQLDSQDTPEEETPKKKSDIAGTLMMIFSILAFGCLAATLVLQLFEYNYFRGAGPKEGDVFAERVLIPPQR